MLELVAAKAAISAAASEPIKSIINKWIIPNLKKMNDKSKVDKKMMDFVTDVFYTYLCRTYEEQENVNIISLGLQQIGIDDVYIPMNLYSEEKNKQISINEFPSKLTEQYKKIVIEDTAGMGKSTIMKKMFVSAIEKNEGIPVFIELRSLNNKRDIIDTIVEEINSPFMDVKYKKDLISRVIERGDFIFFLDGYDEISFAHKEQVTIRLKEFINKAGKNIFILTSRCDNSLSSFGQFQKFSIRNLSNTAAFKLFKKYDNITNFKISQPLINLIKDTKKNKHFEDLDSFLGNPLLASFLYLTYKHKRDIPVHKIDFYRKVYDALYELHDLSKDSFKREKYSKLSCEELRKVLLKLGFLCLKENNNDYDKDKLLYLIKQAKVNTYLNEVDEYDIFLDLIEKVPLITSIGLNYKWAHKSFMEYLAAYFIESQDNREKILGSMFKSKHFFIYTNALDFYYEINRETFDTVLLYPILKEFIEFINKTGINPSTDKLELSFYEFIFNKAIYSGHSKNIKICHSFDELTDYLQKIVKTKVKDYMLWSTIYTMERVQAVFLKNINYSGVLNILVGKRNKLVKNVNFTNPIDFFTSYDTVLTNPIDFNVIQIDNGDGGNEYSAINDLSIDYDEAIKCIKVIEDRMHFDDGDLYSNL